MFCSFLGGSSGSRVVADHGNQRHIRFVLDVWSRSFQHRPQER